MSRPRLPSGSPARSMLLLAALAVLLAGFSLPAAAAELFLLDEREIYLALDKLNAMGRLPGFLANTRPYDMKAVRAALDNNPLLEQYAGFDSRLAKWVAFYAKDTAVARGTVGGTWSARGTDPANGDGVAIPEGFSADLSVLGRWDSLPYLSAHAKGVAVIGEGGERTWQFGDTAVEFGFPYLSLQDGMISAWYGPGRRGALIYTNNAQPYPGLRLHNPVPIPMPWIFSFLGNFQYDIFYAQLGDDRPIPDSRLFGMRLAFRPAVWLEFGLSRAIHYGGEGQDNGLDAFWDAFTAKDLNQQPGVKENELAGFDVEVTLPFRVQPVQLYYEMAGEDQHPSTIPYPTKNGYLAGMFLPAILGNSAFDLRFEWAQNHIKESGPAWYVHPYYPHFNEGFVLGHPMGTDARDLWLQAHWFLLPSTYLQATLNRTDRYSAGPVVEQANRASLGFLGWLTKNVRVEADVAWGKVKNPGGQPVSATNDASVSLALSYQVGRGR